MKVFERPPPPLVSLGQLDRIRHRKSQLSEGAEETVLARKSSQELRTESGPFRSSHSLSGSFPAKIGAGGSWLELVPHRTDGRRDYKPTLLKWLKSSLGEVRRTRQSLTSENMKPPHRKR